MVGVGCAELEMSQKWVVPLQHQDGGSRELDSQSDLDYHYATPPKSQLLQAARIALKHVSPRSPHLSLKAPSTTVFNTLPSPIVQAPPSTTAFNALPPPVVQTPSPAYSSYL